MKFKRKLEMRAVVDLVPMIDVVFQLILFFLVSTTFAVLPGISLDLPQSSTAEGVRTSGITISAEAGGTLYLNREEVSLDTLEAALERLEVTGTKESVPVSLEADAMVSNGTVVRILDALRRTGYTGVNLRAREKE